MAEAREVIESFEQAYDDYCQGASAIIEWAIVQKERRGPMRSRFLELAIDQLMVTRFWLDKLAQEMDPDLDEDDGSATQESPQ